MAEDEDLKGGRDVTGFGREVAQKAARKLRARRNASPGVWFGLGMMGLIGWSVVVPTLLGSALGVWLDSRYPSSHSWTLTLLIVGLSIGCLTVWKWMTKEERAMREEQGDPHE